MLFVKMARAVPWMGVICTGLHRSGEAMHASMSTVRPLMAACLIVSLRVSSSVGGAVFVAMVVGAVVVATGVVGGGAVIGFTVTAVVVAAAVVGAGVVAGMVTVGATEGLAAVQAARLRRTRTAAVVRNTT